MTRTPEDHESQWLLNAIVENIPNMIFVKDAQRLAFTHFNRAGEELLGVPRADLLGKTDFDLFPPSDAEHFQAKDRETLNNKALVDIPEEPLQTKTGLRWLHTKKVTIVDEAGEPRYLLGISEDITDRKSADAHIQAARVAAETANTELESFAYSVAHDLRAPLRGIDGYSQALLEDYSDKIDDEGQRYLRNVRFAAQRMGRLIDDLLTLSRVTRSELHLEPIDLSGIARSIAKQTQNREPTRAMAVEVTIADGLTANADARLATVLMTNLFSNAWKFTSRRPRALIEVGITTVDGEQRFFIRDNGAGFDMQYGNKLFGLFQRLHGANEFDGTGMGLAIVQRIVRRHGGDVWAEGEVDKGATFSFTLSRAKKEENRQQP